MKAHMTRNPNVPEALNKVANEQFHTDSKTQTYERTLATIHTKEDGGLTGIDLEDGQALIVYTAKNVEGELLNATLDRQDLDALNYINARLERFQVNKDGQGELILNIADVPEETQ